MVSARSFIVLAASVAWLACAALANEQAASELETIQNINLHLLNEGLRLDAPKSGSGSPPKIEVSARQLEQMGAIKRALEALRQELELVRGDELLELAQLDDRYKTLLDGAQDARHLRGFLETLASLTCDQVSLDFLMILAQYKQQEASQDSSSLLLQNYAKLRVQQCWRQFGHLVARRLDSALGKMTTPLFRFLERLALKIRFVKSNQKAVTTSKSAASIRIDDSQAQEEAQGADLSDSSDVSSSLSSRNSNQVRQMVAALKEVKLTNEAERGQFSRGVVALFEAYKRGVKKSDEDEEIRQPFDMKVGQFYERFLVQPCAELSERVSDVLTQGAIYKNHIEQTLGQALASEKQSNERLDYELQAYRICKLAEQSAASIKRQLK